MPSVRLREGGFLNTDDVPLADPDETLRFILRADVLLDPLEPDEAEADPEEFVPQIRKYLREIYRTGKDAKLPAVRFEDSGSIGGASYWVFSTEDLRGTDLYVLVVRSEGITEMYGAERNASFAEDGVIHDHVLSPAQAALLDYCAPDL